eukprot:Hpha_TRINITY_DN2213_c0_g1::TRINITY_DN2213_c0_g1_i1::g.25424::m.25424
MRLEGTRVASVTAGGPAHRAGVRVGDCILRVEGVKVDSEAEARDALDIAPPAQPVRVALCTAGEVEAPPTSDAPAAVQLWPGRATQAQVVTSPSALRKMWREVPDLGPWEGATAELCGRECIPTEERGGTVKVRFRDGTFAWLPRTAVPAVAPNTRRLSSSDSDSDSESDRGGKGRGRELRPTAPPPAGPKVTVGGGGVPVICATALAAAGGRGGRGIQHPPPNPASKPPPHPLQAWWSGRGGQFPMPGMGRGGVGSVYTSPPMAGRAGRGAAGINHTPAYAAGKGRGRSAATHRTSAVRAPEATWCGMVLGKRKRESDSDEDLSA